MSAGWASRTAAAAIAAAAVLPCAACAAADEGLRYRPADGESTLLVLPEAARQTDRPATDADGAARQAAAYLELARTTGDARYLGRAEAQIRPWRDRALPPLRIDFVAADLAQRRHAFGEARRRLDRILAASPRNAEARLARANVALLRGEFNAARQDCLAVIQAGSALPGTICLAASMTGRNSTDRARRLLAALDAADRAPTAVLRWRFLTGADLALRAGDSHAALVQLERAHALDSRDDETRARLAELLLAEDLPERALAIADGPSASLARLVARFRAGAALADPRADAWRRELDALLAVARRRGDLSHDRAEARLALHDGGDVTQALTLARRNFAIQKDTPDLRLLVDAAIAADDRESLRSARQWLATTGFEDRVVEAQLRRAGA